MNDPASLTFERERGRLMALAYRMLGERAAAEDVVQNAWLKWSAADRTEIRTPAAWLTTVTTRLAIDTLKSARHAREIYVGVWLPEPVLDDPERGPDTPEEILARTETVELALLWAMERLSPDERAAFILREAFDMDYPDIAETLEKSEAACRQLVARAKKRVNEKSPRFNAPATEVTDLLTRFMQAVVAGNKTEVLSLLAPGALAFSDGGGKARAALRPLVGADDIANVFLSIVARNAALQKPRWVNANGKPALASLQGRESDILVTLAPDGEGRIAWIYMMRNPDKLAAAQPA
ncbi:MAG: RNA polymerase sigma factor SigJ [Parvibaculaceae bacterium]